ncbi:hypothetical protein [Methanobrevibacter arboriphilus]|uniref:Uncharacterized protein n=1 Tax=Methanobrevibacter arboriphilus TaxID=39441 RepID=A0ACA8R1W7_METAZ|nr:hypothetical protein [Methanobrevibacter arboriphilus]BBL61495.1 hypothetical protein MarbSA_05350 [Methanobrevibacter arboriphilus]
MAYDDTSENGDMISDYFDEENNVMNPPSDAGWFFYNLIGKSLDSVSDVYNQSVLNRSPIRCSNSYLNVLGKSMGVKRDFNWSDDEYRAYLILNYYNTATIKGLEYVLNQIAIIETSEIEGYITIEQFRDNFKFSSRFKENELTSDRFITNDLLRTGKSEIVLINVPVTVNIELISFIAKFLDYEVEII